MWFRNNYILYLIICVDLVVSQEHQVNAAVLYSNGYDYMDPIDKDFNYEEHNIDAAESGDIEQQDMNYNIPQRVMYRSPEEMEQEEKSVPLVRRAYNVRETAGAAAAAGAPRQQVERAACGPPPIPECSTPPPPECGGDNRQEALNAALKDTQDTIDHVSNLIKQMREHAKTLLRNINELESDLMASCDDNIAPSADCSTPEPPCNNNGNGGNANGGNDSNNECGDNNGNNNNGNNDNNCNNNNENKCNDNNNNDNKCKDNGNDNNGNGNGNGNSCGVGGDENGFGSGATPSPQSPQLGATQVPLVMNEWSAQVKNDVTQTQSSKDFMAEAQDAVRSWKQQIDACKQILDNAIAQAAQNSANNQSPNYVYKPLPQANTNTNNPSQHASQQPQRVQMAPSAAASLTPVAPQPQHPQQHMSANVSSPMSKDAKQTAIMGKTSELLNKLKKLKTETRMRKFNGKYDQLRAKGDSTGVWDLFN